MNTTWSFLINTFAISTRNSYLKALKLSEYHDAALANLISTYPAMQVLYDRYHPLHVAFVKKYNEQSSASGKQKGNSYNVKQQVKLALGKVNQWDVQIQIIHPKSSPRHKELFPNGHKPFSRGGLDDKINSYNVLSKAIGNEPALAAVKAETDITYQLLSDARTTQEGAKGSKKRGSGNLKTACRDIMNMQYRNACWIADNFFDTRESMCHTLFDLQTLRDIRQRHFTATLKPRQTKALLVRTFEAKDKLRLKLDTEGSVTFYLAAVRGGINSTAVILLSNEDKEITVSDFGISDYSTHRFVTVVNEGGEEVGVVVEVR